jgi:uncharacterized protein (DUF1330 family)
MGGSNPTPGHRYLIYRTGMQALIVLTDQVSQLISKTGEYTMSKGYVVANIRVTDQERFQQFSGMAGPAIKKYGGKVLARGPDADRLEGDVSGIVMMIEFESKDAANTFYHSEEYQAAKAVRDECSDTDFMIIEGVAD